MALMLIFPVFSLVAISDVSAQEDSSDFLWGKTQGTTLGVDKNKIQQGIGLSDSDPRIIVAKIIRVTLGFLGIIAVVIVLVGGFKWMTAFGNEEKVTEARKLMFAGVIGLVIVLASFGIATFVITSVMGAVTK